MKKFLFFFLKKNFTGVLLAFYWFFTGSLVTWVFTNTWFFSLDFWLAGFLAAWTPATLNLDFWISWSLILVLQIGIVPHFYHALHLLALHFWLYGPFNVDIAYSIRNYISVIFDVLLKNVVEFLPKFHATAQLKKHDCTLVPLCFKMNLAQNNQFGSTVTAHTASLLR